MHEVSPIQSCNNGYKIQTQTTTFPVVIPEHISTQHREILKNSKKFRDFIRNILQAPQDIKINKIELLCLQIFRGERMGYATIKVYGEQLTSKGFVSFEDYAFIQGGSVGILVFVNDKLAVVEQYRVAKQQMCYEPPAGMLDQSGDVKSKVLEQLEEQASITISKSDLVYMGSMHPHPDISDQQFYLFYCKIELSLEKMAQIEQKTHGVGPCQRIKVRFIDYDPLVILRSGNSSFITMAAFYDALNKSKKHAKKQEVAHL